MGPCKTSNVSIFTFINASDLKFCTRSYSSCVYRMMRFKGSNGKVCKMMTSHFRILFFLHTLVMLGKISMGQGNYYPANTATSRRTSNWSSPSAEKYTGQRLAFLAHIV